MGIFIHVYLISRGDERLQKLNKSTSIHMKTYYGHVIFPYLSATLPNNALDCIVSAGSHVNCIGPQDFFQKATLVNTKST